MAFSLEKISPDCTKLHDFISDVYHNSFPPAERRKFEHLIELHKDSKYFSIDILKKEYIPIGFISYWTFDDFVYIEHFAIDPGYRGTGAGSFALTSFLAKTPLPVVLEVEKPETEEAIRRIAFYQRLDFTLWDEVLYIQPPYSPELESLELKLMSFGEIDLMEKSVEVIKTLYKYVYNVESAQPA